jgi:serine/threonine-protein kinase RsbW
LLFALVAAGYVLGYKLAQNWFSAEGQHASFFPAAGVTLAALVLVPRVRWWIVLAAAASSEIVLDLWNGTSLLASGGYALANTCEPLVGALLLTSIIASVDLRRTRDLTAFIVCAVLIAPVVGGLIAATTFVLIDDRSGWARFAFEWWSGDGLGVLVVGGALLALRWRPRLPAGRGPEAVALGALAVAVTEAVFSFGWFELVYLPIVVLVVIAFRSGTAAVAVTSAIVAFAAAGATAEAQDFWASIDVTPANRVLYLQLALGVVIAAVLALAAEVSARERMAAQLTRAQSEREAAVERARLFDAERFARERAEILERHAAGLAKAFGVDEVAAMTTAHLTQLAEVDGSSVELVDGEAVRLLAARGSAAAGKRAFTTPFHASDGRLLGRLAMVSSRPDAPDGELRRLLGGLAEQCGLALERALLREEADAAAADLALLARLGEVLVRPSGAHERARALVDALTVSRAALAVVHVLDEDGKPELLEQASSSARAGQVAKADLARLAASSVKTADVVSAKIAGLELLALALRARNRALGVLTIGLEAGGPGVQASLFRRIAVRAALALDNALLYERERDVSHSLQLGLLGAEPSLPAETVIATAYRPGTAALEVGGDWYDAFPLPDGRLGLVVGDVVGHGLEAAVAMGQLRGAVRALAPTGSPRDVLERLDLFVDTLPEAAMATLAYVELDSAEGQLLYACAGHPPPLIVPSAGQPRLLWEGRSGPLGSSFSGDRDEAAERLQPGDMLVLYTDGLVERRSEGLASRIELLLEVAGASAQRSPAALVDAVLDALLAEGAPDDDVCVLVLLLAASNLHFARSFPAAREEVALMRRELSDWLRQLDVVEDVRHDAVLAVSEACANAAEHAYDYDGAGVITVEAWASDGDLWFEVRDRGRWRAPRPATDRGRGRTIMDALMRDVTTHSGENGTVVRMRRSMTEVSVR